MKLTELLTQEGALHAPRMSKEEEAPNGPRYIKRWTNGVVEFIGNGTDAVTDMGDIIAIVLYPDLWRVGSANEVPTWTVIHADHGITAEQLTYIKNSLQWESDGFFIARIDIGAWLGTVPCGLYGPAMGDEPIPRSAVDMRKRGDPGDKFRWLDPVVDRIFRPVNYVHAIGIRDGNQFTLFTVYGGPLAPQHPEDPSNQDPEGAKVFWAQHALATGLSPSLGIYKVVEGLLGRELTEGEEELVLDAAIHTIDP